MKIKTALLMSEFVTHDVKRLVFERPRNLAWLPGQGVLVAINEPGFADKGHPFTPTSLVSDGALEFTIKQYPDHHGVTTRIHKLVPGDEILITEVFGDIQYKGPGLFIAAGAGITPFIAVLRQLNKDGALAGNALIFSNKTWADVIFERELRSYLGENCTFTLTRKKREGYDHRKIDTAFLREKAGNFDKYFYVCGPPAFIEDVNATLKKLGAPEDKIVFDAP